MLWHDSAHPAQWTATEHIRTGAPEGVHESLTGMLDARNHGDNGACYIARRNCSISPQGLIGSFTVIATVSLLIGIGFASHGAWMVLPFAGIELVTLAIAFVCYARHAADYERISVGAGEIEVEVCNGDCVRCHLFNRAWVRLIVRDAPSATRLALRSRGQELEIGRHLDGADRQKLAHELGRWLRLTA